MNSTKPSETFSQAKRAAILSATIFPGAGLFFFASLSARLYLRLTRGISYYYAVQKFICRSV